MDTSYFVKSLVTLLMTPIILAGNITIHPEFVNTNDHFNISCESHNAEETLILRNSRYCSIGCYLIDCFHDRENNVTLSCSTQTRVLISVGFAVEEDFTVWRCDSYTTTTTDYLYQYERSELEYPNFNGSLVERKESSFMCIASQGNPGAVIKWYLNGVIQTNGITQTNSTDIQNSTFTFVADRSHKTIQCEADQVHNKAPTIAEENKLNVMYAPLKATAVNANITVAVNKTATLKCTVTEDDKGNPDEYTFRWTRQKDPDFTFETIGGNLQITPDTVDYEDVYYCTPVNIIGSGTSANVTLHVIGPPSIANFTCLTNTTSKVIPLSWDVEPYQDSAYIYFNLWLKLSHEQEYSKRVIKSDTKMQHITLDVDCLESNSSYDFVLMAENREHSLQSGNLTQKSETKCSPNVTIQNIIVEENKMIVQWNADYQRYDQEITVCVEYWQTEMGRETSVIYPTTYCNIPVDMQITSILANFDTNQVYSVFLHVFENGFKGSNSGNMYLESSPLQEVLSSGEIAAIVISVLLILTVAIIVTLLLTGVLKLDITKKAKSRKQDQYMSHNRNETSVAYENAGHFMNESAENIEQKNLEAKEQMYEELQLRTNAGITKPYASLDELQT